MRRAILSDIHGNLEALEDMIRSASEARSGWQMNAAKPNSNR